MSADDRESRFDPEYDSPFAGDPGGPAPEAYWEAWSEEPELDAEEFAEEPEAVELEAEEPASGEWEDFGPEEEGAEELADEEGLFDEALLDEALIDEALVGETSPDAAEWLVDSPGEEGEDAGSWAEDAMEGETLAASTPPLRARILWPALGFPAVITPPARPSDQPFVDGHAARCITVLVLSNRRLLSKAEAARHLRYVPWSARGRRHIPAGAAGSFREVELAVRNHAAGPALLDPRPKDARSVLVRFGADGGGKNGIVASLANRVREFYARAGLEHLHEIRVYESAAARLQGDQYQLFWNNERAGEDAPSDELALLLERFARPRRAALGGAWARKLRALLDEYEYEYGATHRPYSTREPRPKRRAEILHPLFIRRGPASVLKVGQLSDTHLDVRADVYEENLRIDGAKLGLAHQPVFNNWNTSFDRCYAEAKRGSDVLLLTGDLIDYGRGHVGLDARGQLGDDGHYHVDRNWFLFYDRLAAGDRYCVPSYTILGNHDWRLNPYTPFAVGGAPSPSEYIHNDGAFTKEQLKAILRTAHGPGHRRIISYLDDIESKGGLVVKQPGTTAWEILAKIFGGQKTLDKPGLPTETTVESIEWYLLAINPFLDYRFRHPAGPEFLMLDWAEDENVIHGDAYQGKMYASFGGGAPTARNSLSDLQWAMVTGFAEPSHRAKVIGIHTPPIAPWPDWPDSEVRSSWRAFDLGSRGYPHYSARTADGKTMKGHPIFATRPRKGVVPDAVYGMDASYGSFERRRREFLALVAKRASGVRVVLSGHVHRRGLYVAYPAPPSLGTATAGETLVKAVAEKEVRGVAPGLGALVKVRRSATESTGVPGPLYLVGSSVGPRGSVRPARGPDKKVIHAHVDPGYAVLEIGRDGTIHGVAFHWVKTASPDPMPEPCARAAAGAGAP